MTDLCNYCNSAPAYKTNGEGKSMCIDRAMYGECNPTKSDSSQHVNEKQDAQVHYIIPENKVNDVKAYTQKLRTKFPYMNQHRIMKKVANYFHLETDV